MKVIVLGAGVIGTACAYYLSKAGHEVTVIDRRSGPALETSFGKPAGSVPPLGRRMLGGHPISGGTLLAMSNVSGARRPSAVD